MMKAEQRKEIEEAIEGLKSQLTGDMMSDMVLKDEIHKLEMELNQVKPPDSPFECFGCGS